jgi:hypothetical protein
MIGLPPRCRAVPKDGLPKGVRCVFYACHPGDHQFATEDDAHRTPPPEPPANESVRLQEIRKHISEGGLMSEEAIGRWVKEWWKEHDGTPGKEWINPRAPWEVVVPKMLRDFSRTFGRQAALEEAARAVCFGCRNGHELSLDGKEHFYHGIKHDRCFASAVRALMKSAPGKDKR